MPDIKGGLHAYCFSHFSPCPPSLSLPCLSPFPAFPYRFSQQPLPTLRLTQMLLWIALFSQLVVMTLAAPNLSSRSSKHHSYSPFSSSFVLVGDSTTANGTTPNSGGWSRGFCGSLEVGVFCSNRAANGRTTGTIVTDGKSRNRPSSWTDSD